jgi:cysteine synthase
MNRDRRKLYEAYIGAIGRTPLTELRSPRQSFDGCLLVKEEYRNPTGSHYDREYFRLLYELEDNRTIVPGETPLIETTTGNAGASFAWACRILGYFPVKVIIPADMPSAREAQIRSLGAEIIHSPAGQYVKGIIAKLKSELNADPRLWCPNHAADTKYSIEGMTALGKELVEDFTRQGIRRIDYYVSALGNGSSLRGVGAFLRDQFGTRLIGVEPLECPTNFVMCYPERFEKQYGRPPTHSPHELIGTGAWDYEADKRVDFEFPNTQHMLSQLDDIELVASSEWRGASQELQDEYQQFVGSTSAACFVAAKRLLRREPGANVLLMFYDPLWKYLDLHGIEAGFA